MRVTEIMWTVSIICVLYLTLFKAVVREGGMDKKEVGKAPSIGRTGLAEDANREPCCR